MPPREEVGVHHPKEDEPKRRIVVVMIIVIVVMIIIVVMIVIVVVVVVVGVVVVGDVAFRITIAGCAYVVGGAHIAGRDEAEDIDYHLRSEALVDIVVRKVPQLLDGMTPHLDKVAPLAVAVAGNRLGVVVYRSYASALEMTPRL